MKEEDGMRRRRITLADGRYLIFYTFEEPLALRAEGQAREEMGANLHDPEARPQAEEERGV